MIGIQSPYQGVGRLLPAIMAIPGPVTMTNANVAGRKRQAVVRESQLRTRAGEKLRARALTCGGQVIPAERCSAETQMVRERPFVGEALLMIVQVRTILSGSKKERHRGWTAARPRNQRAWARPCSRPRRRVSLTGSSRQTLARAGGAFSLTRRCCPGCFISKAIDDINPEVVNG